MVMAAIGRKGNTSPAAEATKRSRAGKANGSRECAPDDKLRMPTSAFKRKKVGTAQARLCPPYAVARNDGERAATTHPSIFSFSAACGAK
jgi:hypothetical protein